MPRKPFSPSRILAVDTRSLALFRIALGLLFLLDSAQKAFLARELFTDWGIFPRAYWIEHYLGAHKFSFHLASGEAWFQYLLLGLQALAALAFTLGWRARLANLTLLLLVCSLQSRNNQILSAADELLRLLLLWCLFVPVAERFAFRAPAARSREVASAGTFALLGQGFSMYLFTALLKLHPVWTTELSAVYYALHLDLFSTPLAAWLRPFFRLTQALTAATLAWELAGPVLALLSTGWLRFAVSALFILFHLSHSLFLELGLFPYAAIAYWLLYWPPELWASRAGRRAEAALEAAFRPLPAASAPPEPGPRARGLAALTAVFLFSLATWNNLDSLQTRYVRIPAPAASLVRLLYLDQRWDMFAPYPIRNDGWFVIDAEFRDGSSLDLWSQRPATREKPAVVSATFPSTAWRKIMVHAWDEANPRILLPLARFFCRKFSEANGWPSDVARLRITFLKETTPPPGQPFQLPEERTLWAQDCGDERENRLY